MRVDDALIAAGEPLQVLSMNVRVMRLEDLLTSKLLAVTEHTLDFGSLLQIARALRERIDWDEVRARTVDSPYAAAFFTLLEKLAVIQTEPEHAGVASRIRLAQ